jgi:hypothetical protein
MSFMDAAVHTFPLPEPETHKLEVLTEELRHQPSYEKRNETTWQLVVAGFAVGLAIYRVIKMLRR